MAQTYEQSETPGTGIERPRVTVENCSNRKLEWLCQHYVPDKHLHFNFAPGEKDKMDYDYARRVFGDWEINPDESRLKLKEWNGMMGYTIRRSPSGDGKLADVKIYDPDDNLLWDARVQMERWLEHNAVTGEAFAKINAPGSFGGPVAMPEILANATYDQLKVLWESSWGSKMPAGIKAEVARDCLLPRMTANQIKDALEELYSGPPPDMSQYSK